MWLLTRTGGSEVDTCVHHFQWRPRSVLGCCFLVLVSDRADTVAAENEPVVDSVLLMESQDSKQAPVKGGW